MGRANRVEPPNPPRRHRAPSLSARSALATDLDEHVACGDELDANEPLGLAVIYWVQGLRRPVDHQWQDVLRLRLEGSHHLIRSGRKTLKAEKGLRLKPSAYFYVSRCDPDFGWCAVAFTPPEHSNAEVTELDTGGFFAGLLNLARISLPLKRAVVRHHTHPADTYLPSSQQWGRANYNSSADYVRGESPRHNRVKELTLTAGADPRHWTWEARIPLSDFPDVGLEPRKAVLATDQYRGYRGWLLTTPKLSTTVRGNHIRLLARVGEATQEHRPGVRMTEWLETQELW